MTENNKKSEIKYFLGIDGGGTKTEFLMTDQSKKELKRIILGASNPINIGIDNTKTVLNDGISEICRDFDLREISLFAGIAGGSSGNNQAEINDFLSGFGFGAFGNGSDTDNALEIALGGKNGVAVIMGTGIVAFSCLDGIRRRIGGFGYLIDKGGSGFCFGADAFDSAFRCLDGRGGSKLILQLIEKYTGKALSDSIADIYGKGISYVASFAPIVFDAYNKGDTEAEKIIERNTKEAAQIIRTGCNFLNKSHKEAVILGGLCRQKDILTPFFTKHLGDEFKLTFSAEPMINGAVMLAEKAAEEKI